MIHLRLLELDGVGNVLLGLPLLFFPREVTELLGLPPLAASFYPAILGSIFVGIGVALLVERFRPSLGGLGLGGAIAINLIFGITLAGWLLFTRMRPAPRGMLVLSILAVILVGISLVEAISLSRSTGG
jgi:hypothetical protein